MLKDNVFPIFIAWNSAPVNSLGQHLFRVRDGEDWRIWGPVTAPLMLVSDLLTAVAKAPIAIPSMAVSDISTINKVRNHNIFFKNVDTIIKYNESLNEPNKFNIKDGSNTRYLWRNIRHFFQYTATFPLKTVGTPFVIAFGKPMWQIMERRTQTLFRRTSEFDLREINDEPDMVLNSLKYKPTGALAVAMNLINMAQVDMPQNWNKIDVIAHSMGTMVCNQLLYYFPTFKINNIVYMGAACRISDFEAKTIPYLYKNIETTFYNLSLHPIAEKKEISAFEIGPRGSLLEWIDIFFNTSTSIKEKTLGKWLNII
ncbi:MAG: hypothetical protein JHD28_02130, partial [Bacteroidia bacterium]|nr:hypothetical protein [Bacteroidia bacterium]